jgi:hypothetical protein
MKKLLFSLLFVGVHLNLFSQKFTEVKGILPSLNYSQVQFLDYDCDNDLDIFLWGVFDPQNETYRDLILYKNNGAGQFDSIMIAPSVRYGSTVGWIGASDENNDNIPEIIYMGEQEALKFSQYSNGTFNLLTDEVLQGITPGGNGASFADFDSDGYDELLVGPTLYDTYKNIYEKNIFTDVHSEKTRWIEMNNDGKSDILRIHLEQYINYSTSSIYTNTGSGFKQSSFNYTSEPGNWETADFNNDGFEDLLIFFYPDFDRSNIPIAQLFKNDTNGGLTYVKDICNGTTAQFADMDNDGDLDIVVYGNSDVWDKYHLKFFMNNGNDEFVETENDTLATDEFGDLVIGDYDNDGDNDILVTSYAFGNKKIVRLYRNMLVEDNPAKANTPPSVPVNVHSSVNFNHVRLTWDASTDPEMPSASLTYNVCIRKSDGTFVTSPNADLETGYKRFWRKGNAGYKNYYEINCLSDGDYTWAVQAVDNSNKGSGFSQIGTFSIHGTKPEMPDNVVATPVSHKVIHLQWRDNSDIEDGYIIEMYFDSIPYFRSPGFYEVSRVTASITSCNIENLTPDTQYTFRIKAYNCSSDSPESTEIKASTYPIPFTKTFILDKAKGVGAQCADFDRDGDMDFLVNYVKSSSVVTQSILENHTESDTITELTLSLPSIYNYGSYGASKFFDYNNDGLPDICVVDPEYNYSRFWIYKNNGDKTFSSVMCDTLDKVPCFWISSFADYDNDGDNDILFSNSDGAIIYENLGNGRFVESKAGNINGVIKSEMPWCDYDKDGYLDILANEPQSDNTSRIVIYKNNGNKEFAKIVFEDLIGLGNYGYADGDMRWGDYNNDGYPDILISGRYNESGGSGITKIYVNNGNGTFSESGINNIYGQTRSVSVEWGDLNNDGLLDILMSGENEVNGLTDKTRIYYYSNGGYVRQAEDYFINVSQYGSSRMADYDNDGDLDVLVLGEASSIDQQIALYRNFQPNENVRPGVPSNLRIEQEGNEIILRWDKANDNETQSDGLTYNVYIKGSSGNIVDPSALESGKRTVVSPGNAGYNNFYRIKHLKNGLYTWSVQSIDNCYEGSEFASEGSFDYVRSDVTDIKPDNSQRVIAYPNPCLDKMTINVPGSESGKFDIIVSDLKGEVISEINAVYLPYDIHTESFRPGVYIVTLRDDDSGYSIKIEKR